VLIITAIVITGFTSLVPLLTFLGLSVKLATVVSVTVCGIAFLASSIYLLGYPLNILGKIFKSDTLKTISFGLRHPIISLQIGKVKPGVGNTNISTNASRFANAFDFEDNDAQEGSEVNAFRHTFWISIITSKWGENIGLQVGNAHEKNQNVIHEIKDIYSHRFKTLGDADQAVDLLNNVIGREIGKTTSIGKMANRLAKDGKKVVVAAADTFRAAAVEQLEIWAKRAGADIVKRDEGVDPASVVFDAIKKTKENGADVLIVDTAGRLHNKKYLMDELNKIQKVINKEMPDADKEVLLVIDGTTGQNAISQVKAFKQETDITGIVLTKLDGTAKGGVVIGIVEENKIPVKFIGVGEQIDDMEIFNSEDFVKAII